MSNAPITNATVLLYPRSSPRLRTFALWYFTVLMILWNVLGHTVLGFEQSWASPFVGVGVAIMAQYLFEWVDAIARGRPARFAGGVGAFLNQLPPALIPGFACAMLLYPNDRLWPIAFASVLSIASKILIRAPIADGGRVTQHVFNPSNLAVACTLVLFPWVGFAPPYHFTENLIGVGHWVLPGCVLATGIVIHALFTGRLPLCAAWVVGFAAQGLIRARLAGAPLHVPLTPMTSAAFVLFTLYMIPDPATSPLRPRRQVMFGLSVAFVYGALQLMHVVFGLFFALVIVCAVRGAFLWAMHLLRRPLGATSRRETTGLAGAKPAEAALV